MRNVYPKPHEDIEFSLKIRCIISLSLIRGKTLNSVHLVQRTAQHVNFIIHGFPSREMGV